MSGINIDKDISDYFSQICSDVDSRVTFFAWSVLLKSIDHVSSIRSKFIETNNVIPTHILIPQISILGMKIETSANVSEPTVIYKETKCQE